MAQITSREELEAWLQDKPVDWAQVIAARSALRALPYVFGEQAPKKWINDFALSLIRATAMSWAARNFMAHDMVRATRAAVRAAVRASYAVPDAVVYAAIRAATDGADAAYIARVAADAAADAAYIARVAADADAAYAVSWANIRYDCDWLGRYPDHELAAQQMTSAELWLAGEVEGWREAWGYAAKRLRAIDASYQVWIDWCNLRFEGGNDMAFDIPGDHDRTEDKKILARLADATDEEFWGKGATYVNTTLQRWIDEARNRAIEDLIYSFPEGIMSEPEPIPPQNQNAITFTATEAGKIRIDARRNADALRTDGDAQDRHGEAIREARALLDRCRLSNSAARFVSGFENYLAAGGDTLADLRPSLFVQRGEKLRQEIAAYESGQQDSFLEPIADDLLIDLKGWRSAHNMAIGLDPVLMRLDTAMLGPDVKPTLIAPSELHAFIADADEADILDEGVREIVDEAIDLAPAIPDANDRRTVWSVESVQNLVIEAFSVALNHPRKVAVGVAFTAAVGVKVAAGVAGGALVSAKFLIKHRTWIETRLNNTPTWQSLFNQVCDRLEEWTPFKTSKDDDGV